MGIVNPVKHYISRYLLNPSLQPAEPVLPEESGPSIKADCIHTRL